MTLPMSSPLTSPAASVSSLYFCLSILFITLVLFRSLSDSLTRGKHATEAPPAHTGPGLQWVLGRSPIAP